MNKKEFAINRQKQMTENLDNFLYDSMSNKGDIEKLISHYKISGLYNYSMINSMMILMQEGTICQSFKNWQKLGRNVIKGEKAKIFIYLPLFFGKKKEEEEENEDSAPTWEKVFFKLKPIFDISQTEGEDLKYDHNTTDNFTLEYDKLSEKLQKIVKQKIVTEITGNSRGYCSKDIISVSIMSNNIDSVKTLIHETAHSLFNHIESDKDKGVKETEAESVSYLVMEYLNIDYSLSTEYVNGYINSTVNEIDRKGIIKISDKIIKSIKESK